VASSPGNPYVPNIGPLALDGCVGEFGDGDAQLTTNPGGTFVVANAGSILEATPVRLQDGVLRLGAPVVWAIGVDEDDRSRRPRHGGVPRRRTDR
jgi:hypothetical protein